jgi:hypothetical protein
MIGISTGVWSSTGGIWTPQKNLPAGVLQGMHIASNPSITLDGSQGMSSLPDEIVGKPALTQSNSLWRPVYNTTDWNGKASLRFNGSKTMHTASNISLKGRCAIISLLSSNNANFTWEMGNTAATTGAGEWMYSDPSLPVFLTRVGAGGGQSIYQWSYASPFYNQPVIITHYCDGTHAGHLVRVNGANWPITAFGAPYNTDPGAAKVAANPLYYAMRGDTGGAGASVINWGLDLYLQDQSLTDVINVENYIRNQYNMQYAGEGVMFGDSTTGSITVNTTTTHTIGYYLRGTTLDPLNCRVVSLAVAGETPTMQHNHWIAASPRGSSTLKWGIYLCGVNRIVQDASSATILSEINTTCNDFKARNPTAKLIVCTLLPCYTRLVNLGANVATRQAALVALNTSIKSGGVPAADAVIDLYSLFGDISDSRILKLIYDLGDGIHENDALREIIAGLYRNQLAVWGL